MQVKVPVAARIAVLQAKPTRTVPPNPELWGGDFLLPNVDGRSVRSKSALEARTVEADPDLFASGLGASTTVIRASPFSHARFVPTPAGKADAAIFWNAVARS